MRAARIGRGDSKDGRRKTGSAVRCSEEEGETEDTSRKNSSRNAVALHTYTGGCSYR